MSVLSYRLIRGSVMKSSRRAFKRKVRHFDPPKLSTIFEPEIERKQIDDTFQFAIAPVATIFQFLALMPVCGISSKDDPRLLTFKWKSLRVCYTLAHISYGVFVSSFMFSHIYNEGISAKNIVGFVFFSYTTICAIVFLFIAIQWPKLMSLWVEKEQRFVHAPYKPHGSRLSKKVRLAACVVFILAFSEHILFNLNNINNQLQHVAKCNWTLESPVSHLLTHQFWFIFSRVPFSLLFGILVETLNMSMTFGWNYMDLFVMMVSLGLLTRFWQINERMIPMRGKILPERDWIEIRTDYVVLCELMEKIDYELRFLILLSNLNNLYFVCFQLLNIYDSLPSALSYVYFWFSLIYLFGRTLMAQYLAALIHEASNFPLSILNSVPYEGWSVEVQRFIDQIRAQKMAFSGWKFFHLTRKSISAMLATIVTYELVLLQFDSDPNEQVDNILNADECVL